MKSIQVSGSHTDFLEKLGLSSDESRVYLALLEHGAMGVSDIARATKLYRTDVYEAVESLLHDGLVSVAPRGKYKRYSAESPRKLEARFLELSNRFDNEMSSLNSLYESPDACRPKVKYVEGAEQIRAINDDVVTTLKKGDVFYRYSSANVKAEREKRDYLSKKYRVIRDQKQLERFVITNVPNKERKTPRLGRAVKIVPPTFDLFDYNISQIIYGNKVAVIDYNTETAVVIENASVAKFQEKIFQLLFRKL